MPSRRSATTAALACLLLASACESGTMEAPRKRPDVIVFVVDTLRKDRLSCYGYPRPTSPNLDRLAAEGVLFEDANSQASWTQPSVVSMFTGRYVTAFRSNYPEEATTLAEAFHRAGYRTLGVVGNVLLSTAEGYDRGFDYYDAREAVGHEKRPGMIGRTTEDLVRALRGPLETALKPGTSKERPPLFVYVHPMDPHDDYMIHPSLTGVLPLKEIPRISENAWHKRTFADHGPPAPETDRDWQASWNSIRFGRAYYDMEVRYTDERIGDALAYFEELGLLENAIVAVVADHGESLWQRVSFMREADSPPEEFFHKTHAFDLYQELIGTPFLLWGAGVPAGVRVTEPVENVDLFPTLLELADVSAPDGLHGKSLSELMHGRAPDWDKDVHAFVMQHVALRDAKTGLKLILPTPLGEKGGSVPQLFALHEDPGELENLAAERAADVERLRGKLEEWRARHAMENSFPKDPKTIENMRALGYVND